LRATLLFCLYHVGHMIHTAALADLSRVAAAMAVARSSRRRLQGAAQVVSGWLRAVHVEEAAQQYSRRTRLPTVFGLPRDMVTFRAAGVSPSGLYCFLVARMRTLCSLQADMSGFQHTHSAALSSSESGGSSDSRPLHTLARQQQQDAELRRGILHAPRCRRASMGEVLTPRVRWHCLCGSTRADGQVDLPKPSWRVYCALGGGGVGV
jgi:hypothetical protein